jgi:exodeoxyribonuclease VII large subunit
MTLPLFEETYSVSQLADELRGMLREAFPSVWVAGEIHALKVHRSGHVYLDLVEKGARDAISARLDAVLWARDYERVRRQLAEHGQPLAEGMTIRCRITLDFYGPHGKLQAQIREVDPIFTLGALEQRRRATLQALAEAGLLERNRALRLPDLPLAIALVTSEGSAAYHDFLSTLGESGYGFKVLFVHAAVQGARAEAEICAALAFAAQAGAACAVIVRGGGARADLAIFDSRRVAEAVARSLIPVITGLGHETDDTIADRVAHTVRRTPTKAAEFLVELVTEADNRFERVRRELLREAREPLLRAMRRVDATAVRLRHAAAQLAHAGNRVEDVARHLTLLARSRLSRAAERRHGTAARLIAAAPRLLRRAAARPAVPVRRLADLARGRLGRADAALAGLARLSASLAPAQTLRRGYSVTRTASGKLVRSRADVRAGEILISELARGTVRSRVDEGGETEP